MEFLTNEPANVISMPLGVTSIDDAKTPKRIGSRTLSKAVSLHLEGKRESAAKMLSKAIEGGEHDPALYSALGHIQYEMRDYEAAARTYAQLVELEPQHRTGALQPGGLPGQPEELEGRGGCLPPRRRSGRHARRRPAGAGNLADPHRQPGAGHGAAGQVPAAVSRARAGAVRQGREPAADRPAERSGGSVSQGAGAQSALRRGALQPGGHVPGEERPRIGAPLCRHADRTAAGFHRGDGSHGHAGVRRRRLPERRAFLPQPFGNGARPV